jgi:periplasmic divalent cation tolerance protein
MEGVPMNEYIQVLVSIDSEDGAKELQRLLVDHRAAACVQVLGPISSTYWWQGKMEDAQEWLCLAKTQAQLYEKLESLVKENHPYETPEIIAVPILVGNKAYLEWIEATTI